MKQDNKNIECNHYWEFCQCQVDKIKAKAKQQEQERIVEVIEKEFSVGEFVAQDTGDEFNIEEVKEAMIKIIKNNE